MSTEHTPSTEEQRSSFQSVLESLEVPQNIDPRLLALWIEREQEEWAKKQKDTRTSKKEKTRKLSILFAAFLGILAMCLTIVLGLVHNLETGEILANACQTFLVYTVIGFAAGLIAEYCVAESVETLLREIIRRSHEAEPPSTEQAAESS